MAELEKVTLGGGCFWCVEAVFKELRGVEAVVSGYAGGAVQNPTYHQVCSGTTGHAEVIQVTFDPDVISFENLLYVFWRVHDPTTLNRQGADAGTQYRSIVLYHSEKQKTAAEKSLRETDESGLLAEPIVTEIVPLDKFYEAEGNHQDYYQLNLEQLYCQRVIDPKIQKFRKQFEDRLKVSV